MTVLCLLTDFRKTGVNSAFRERHPSKGFMEQTGRRSVSAEAKRSHTYRLRAPPLVFVCLFVWCSFSLFLILNLSFLSLESDTQEIIFRPKYSFF